MPSASASWPSESKNIDVTLFLYFLFCIYSNAISVAEPIVVPPPAVNPDIILSKYCLFSLETFLSGVNLSASELNDIS